MLTYDLSSQNQGAKYLRLYELIKADITSGAIPAGSKLPSKRTLAEHIGVSVITVEAAYGLLVDEGYVTSVERSGYFVTEIAAPSHAAGLGGGLTLVADPPFAPREDIAFRYSALTKIMREVIGEYGERLLVKSPNFGCAELRNAIALFLMRYRGMRAEPCRIVIGAGAEYLYGMIVQLLGRDKLYGVEDPSYEKIREVYEASGAKCELLSLDEDGVASAALASSKADVLHVTPYHSFPTGISAPAGKRFEYLSWASSGERYIIEDDFDSEFSVSRKPQETLYSMDRQGIVIYVNTFSHSLAPSMRMGYMVLPERLMRLYEEKLGFYSCSVPLFDQLVLAEFISRGFFERHLNRVRRKLKSSPHTQR